MRCVLIYNPVSGRRRNRRVEGVQKAAQALIDLGHEALLIATTEAGSATSQTRKAVLDGAEVVFACGGDGTIHEVLQGLVFEAGKPSAALGVLPLGSANALARHLGLSLLPEVAAIQSIQGQTRVIPIGKVSYSGQSRYFIVMAGAGPDGVLVHQMLGAHKSVLGRMAYYLHAARIFASYRFHPFQVELTDAQSGIIETHRAVSVMAVRVDDLGGLFSRLVRRSASVHQSSLEIILLRPPAFLSLPLWFAFGWLGLNRLNPFLLHANVSGFACPAGNGAGPHFQADGEWIGRVPICVSLVPDALRILIPS